MKKSDLYREWARVMDMCDSTGVMPWHCVVVPETREPHRNDRMPDFVLPNSFYEFAVAILEDKPVFVGDRIWLKSIGAYSIVPAKEALHTGITDEYCSWVEPKKTFMLNGVELPCPDGKDDYYGYSLDILHKKFHKFYFKNNEDEIKVAEAIIKLLEDARK